MLLPGERESFCQCSVNERNTCPIGYHSRSIPNKRRSWNALPSKQAVAGSSPVSRSLIYIISLQADEKQPGDNQAVFGKVRRRCFYVHKGLQRHPASRKSSIRRFKHLFSSDAVLVSSARSHLVLCKLILGHPITAITNEKFST
jgi:hypothetical protein